MAMGLDSMVAMILSNRIRRDFGRAVSGHADFAVRQYRVACSDYLR